MAKLFVLSSFPPIQIFLTMNNNSAIKWKIERCNIRENYNSTPILTKVLPQIIPLSINRFISFQKKRKISKSPLYMQITRSIIEWPLEWESPRRQLQFPTLEERPPRTRSTNKVVCLGTSMHVQCRRGSAINHRSKPMQSARQSRSNDPFFFHLNQFSSPFENIDFVRTNWLALI